MLLKSSSIYLYGFWMDGCCKYNVECILNLTENKETYLLGIEYNTR